jgi:hypothetical protein
MLKEDEPKEKLSLKLRVLFEENVESENVFLMQL